MSVSPLSPYIKPRKKPGISAKMMAEYLIDRPDQQENLLSRARFPKDRARAHWSESINAVADYCVDLTRNARSLEMVKDALIAKAHGASIHGIESDRLKRNAEAIQQFQDGINVWAIGHMRFEKPPKTLCAVIDGLEVSAKPTMVARGANDTFGLGFVVPIKTPDPRPEAAKKSETRESRLEYRREIARYMLTIAQRVQELAPSVPGSFDPKLSFALDLVASERIEFPTRDHKRRVKAFEAACTQVSRAWPYVTP